MIVAVLGTIAGYEVAITTLAAAGLALHWRRMLRVWRTGLSLRRRGRPLFERRAVAGRLRSERIRLADKAGWVITGVVLMSLPQGTLARGLTGVMVALTLLLLDLESYLDARDEHRMLAAVAELPPDNGGEDVP